MTAIEVFDKTQLAKTIADLPKEESKSRKTEKKEKKKEKKRLKKKRKQEAPLDVRDAEEKSEAKEGKEDKKAFKATRAGDKRALLEKVPRTNEHGVPYTKLQIRRMARRVKRGLPAVETAEEERERKIDIAREKTLEQKELAGMLWNGGNETHDDSDGEAEEEDNDSVEEDAGAVVEEEEEDDGDDVARVEEDDVAGAEEDETERMGDEAENDEAAEASTAARTSEPQCKTIPPPGKKKRRSKPVPSDYVCSACQNKSSPLHWIYDCPNKVRKPGTNQVKRKPRVDAPSRKVFVSGLPFEIDSQGVQNYFQNVKSCGEVVHCKLMLFGDTKRCKGQGFVTFGTDAGAEEALKLDGIPFDLHNTSNPAQKETDATSKAVKKKELKLSVARVRNRTKNKKDISKGPPESVSKPFFKDKDHYIKRRMAKKEPEPS